MILVCFLAVQFFQIKNKKLANNGAQKESIEDIFDLSDSYKNGENEDLSDLTINEMKEKGAEFVYQSILKNQVQINDLKQQIQNLNSEFSKYKSQEKLGKIIFAYIDFRRDLLGLKPYQQDLRNFEMIIFADQILQDKVEKLKPLLTNFNNQKQLQKSFKEIIPELLATNNSSGQNDFLSKVRHYISKLIVIRRIDGKNPNDIDGIILKIEQSLSEENYQEALNSSLLLDQNYHQIMTGFLEKLNNALEIQKIDQGILDYLKKLTS